MKEHTTTPPADGRADGALPAGERDQAGLPAGEREQAVLPADVRDALLADGRADELDAGRSARMRARIWSRIGAASRAKISRDVLAGPWTPLFEGCEMRGLSDDGVTRTWLIRLAAGRRLPPHDHLLAAEQCLIVSGEALVGDTRFTAGDFHVALRGSHHADVRTDVGCVLLLRSPSPGRERAAARP